MPEDDDDGKVEDGASVDEGEGKEPDDLITLINASDFEDEGGVKNGEKEGGKEGDGKDKKGGKDSKDTGGKKPDGKEEDTEKAELIRKNKDLNRALHEIRQENKGLKAGKKDDKDDGETVLTDAQLESLLAEFKDDPKTLLNINKHVAQEAAKGIVKTAAQIAETAKTKKETDAYVYEKYPDLTQDDSELRVSVNKTKDTLGLNDHPYGELLGTSVTALMSLPTLLKNAYDKGRKDVEDGVKEKTRKDLIKDGDLTPKGKGKGDGGSKQLTADQSDVAKRLGLNTPRQQALLKKFTGSKGSRTVSVED